MKKESKHPKIVLPLLFHAMYHLRNSILFNKKNIRTMLLSKPETTAFVRTRRLPVRLAMRLPPTTDRPVFVVVVVVVFQVFHFRWEKKFGINTKSPQPFFSSLFENTKFVNFTISNPIMKLQYFNNVPFFWINTMRVKSSK